MSRYVDVEPLDVVGTKGVSKDYAEGMTYVLDLFDNLPTVDIEPVRHGHWEGKTYKCSLCGKWIDPLQGDADMNYCPNCGAKMDEKEQENEMAKENDIQNKEKAIL